MLLKRTYPKFLSLLVASLVVGMVFSACCLIEEPEPTPTPTPVPTPQPLSSFEEFEAMDLADLGTLQLKLTYIGEQTKAVPTVAITSHSHDLDMDCFKPFRKQGVYYGNDELPTIVTITVTPEELEGMIAAISNISAVKEGSRDGGFLSFMMCKEVAGETKGFEAILDSADAEVLLQTIINELESESTLARQILEDYMEILF